VLGLDPTSSLIEARPFVEPADALERDVQRIWQQVLGLDAPPSADIEFFELGGDSLHATDLLVEVENTLGRRLDASVFLTAPTVRGMAAELRVSAADRAFVKIVPVQIGGTKPPLFCLLRAGSIVATRYVAADLGPDQPVYAIWLPSMHGPHD